jgi:hypothetical protein
MAQVVTELDSTASPEKVLGALTDFSPRRFDLWPNVDRDFFKLEAEGETSAEVTEGTPAVWERARYDWSRPGTVRIEVTDSNAFEPGSYWLYRVTPGENGGSHVRMEFDRRPRNFKGKLLSALLRVAGAKLYGKQLGETLRRVEAGA